MIAFDMDGVLAQFVRGTLALHHSKLSHADITDWNMGKLMGIADSAFYAPMGFDFWSSLTTYADGMELFDLIIANNTGERIALLSSPVETHGCYDGKRVWVKRHLPGMVKSLFVGSDKSLFAHAGAILIDDSDTNVASFREAGGQAVLIPRPWNVARGGCDATGHFNPRRLAEQIVPLL